MRAFWLTTTSMIPSSTTSEYMRPETIFACSGSPVRQPRRTSLLEKLDRGRVGLISTASMKVFSTIHS